jgi:hypothetical protein
MKRLVVLSTSMLLSLPVISNFALKTHNRPALAAAAATANGSQLSDDETDFDHSRSRLNACAAPNHVMSSIEETAWRLWVAATCPVNQNQYPYVVWENWIEQELLYPPDPANGLKVPNSGAQLTSTTHSLHASPLALAKDPSLTAIVPGLLGAPDQNCNKSGTPPSNQPNLVLCEEVRENGATEDFVAGRTFWNRSAQEKAAAAREHIEFPAASVEIKADWIQLSTIGLDCNKLPPGFSQSVHIEMINGNCFALAGMHLISKLLNNWIWATFEPQNLTTNPNRCKVLGCTDHFGSEPSQTNGANTKLTRRLSKLMDAANLAPEWKNYRLDGVQIFFTEDCKPTLLGNSIIEGENAGVPLREASCISCHAVSSIKSDGTDGIKFLMNVNPVGKPEPLPSEDWIRRDFVWSLLLACPGSGRCTP